MTTAGFVRLQGMESGVRVLSMDRPPVNALGLDLVAELEDAAARLAADDRARCLVLRSGGKHFCAGADLKERREMSADEAKTFGGRLSSLMTAIAALPFPTIASVRGTAAGGGLELALACDLRVLAEDASVGLRETALGILPGAGGTQRLPRLIGPSRAKLWIFTARMHTAADALRDGVADAVVPADRLDDAALELAREIAGNGPVALRLAKRAVDRGLELPIQEGLAVESECYAGVLGTEDRLEALRAFTERRPPKFTGR